MRPLFPSPLEGNDMATPTKSAPAEEQYPLIFRLITEPKIGSAFIRYFSWSPYSHIDLVLPPDAPLPPPKAGTFLGARLKGGVAIRPTHYTKPTKELYVQFMFSKEDAMKGYHFAYDQLGKPYDFRAILAFPFHFLAKPTDGTKWFCDELSTSIMKAAGKIMYAREPFSRLTPRDDAIWPGWTVISKPSWVT